MSFLWLLLLASAGLLKGSLCDQVETSDIQNHTVRARYDHMRVYSVYIETDAHVKLFKQLYKSSDSLIFMGYASSVGMMIDIKVAATKVPDFEDLLHSYNVTHNILDYNYQALIDANYAEVAPLDTPPDQFDWKRYFQLENIYAWMEKLASEQPKVVTVLDMGFSTQGLSIKGLRIAFGRQNLTSVFIESGIHGREWIAPATATYIIDQLLHSNDSSVQAVARSHNWLIFPVVNPDGYRYTFSGDRMWRKNRNLYGICRGVDLDRNFPLRWNTSKTSNNPCHESYAGPAAASEVETQRIMQFMEARVQPDRIRTFISLHSYFQYIVFPYSHTSDRVENFDDLTEIGRMAASRIKEISGRDYISGNFHEIILPLSGGSPDWVYGHLKVPITFNFQLRGPPESQERYMLPAKEIEQTGEETFAAIQVIVGEARKRGYYQ